MSLKQLCSHLTVIEEAYAKNPKAAAFRVPVVDSATKEILSWATVTYEQFRNDILAQASFWTALLREKNVPVGSTVTVWIQGVDYSDVTLIQGLSRAGYAVELISFSIPSPEAVVNLSKKADSKLIICDVSKKAGMIQLQAALPIHRYSSVEHMKNLSGRATTDSELPTVFEAMKDPKGVALILHTSGSSSGRPKLVPWTWEWIDTNLRRLQALFPPFFDSSSMRALGWIGTACHAAQNLCMMSVWGLGACMVQPTQLLFSSEELMDMVDRCNLGRLQQFGSHFSTHIKHAKKNPELKKVLQSLDGISIGGMPMSDDDMNWCKENRIPLAFSFASTEAGLMLRSVPGKPFDVYESIAEPGLIEFIPIHMERTETNGEVTNGRRSDELLEMVLMGDAVGCPDVSLRDEDGNFHMGDLFLEVEPGHYQTQGRGDDWIKLESSGRCNARAVEGNALRTCHNLVYDCVVIGSQRPEIVLVVEVLPHVSSKHSEAEIKHEIIRRLAPTQEMLWAYEKLIHERQIRVAPINSLPRTADKGTIKRKVTEEMYREDLDAIYATA